MLAGTATRWVWAPGAGAIDIAALQRSIKASADIHVAIGSTADGVEGFRRSHFGAITTQQLMARLGSAQRLARFADVHLVTLVTSGPGRAAEFVTQTLGGLESAGPELRETTRVFIEEQCNASRAASPE